MKYLSQIISFLVGSAMTAGVFVALSPPSSIEIGLELGRKLGLAAAEERYADYEEEHAVLTVQVEEETDRADAAETALSDFRDRSYAEVARLKNVADTASLAQEQAMEKKAGLEEEVDFAWEALDQVTIDSDEDTQKAVGDAKLAAQGIYNNLKAQLDAANEENGSLRLQLEIKDREVVALSYSLNAWKSLAESERLLREDAEAYISDVNDSGFYVGIGGSAGYFKLASGPSGPGAGIALNAGWRFR